MAEKVMAEKVKVLMPWAQSLLNKKKEKVIKLNTWYECDNCNDKVFNIKGEYYVRGGVFCEDCMRDYLEQVDNSFESKSFDYGA